MANPGQEYLVLQPAATAEPFTVTLAAGDYAGGWYDVISRRTSPAEPVKVAKDEEREFRAPFSEAEPVVLYLKRSN